MSSHQYQRHKIFNIGWQIILSLCVILSLTLTLRNNVNITNCPIDKIMNYMGVIATVVGLVITCYFVVLAIDMFSIYRDIRSTKETLTNDTIAFQKRQIEYDKILKDYAQSLYDGFEAQIGLASSSGNTTNKSLLKELQIKKARLSYKYPMLDIYKRMKLLLELGNIGDTKDIIPIQRIIEDKKEPEEIKKIAQKVLEELKKRLGLD